METIHLKTVDPVSQALLQSAAARGLDFNWERYEKLQPQDGFLRAGLSCPFGCMQGPCRIDPFGRGAEQGICGLDRDQMVAALLLRLCLNGVLEAVSDLPGHDNFRVPAWPDSLKAAAARALEYLGGDELTLNEAFQSAGRLHRPSATAEDLIHSSLRLAMLTLALMTENGNGERTAVAKEEKIICRVGYGLLAGADPVIGICGQPPAEFLTGLVGEARANKPDVGLVSPGDWIVTGSDYLPIACTSGEAELLLSSGRISLVLCGSGIDPSIPAICKKLDLPLIFTDEAPEPSKILHLAVESHNSRARTDFFQDTLPVEATGVAMSAEALQTELKGFMETGFVLIGGTDTPQQSLGWIATEVALVLRGQGFRIACWGDAALWMVKRGMARDENEHPVRLLSPLRGPLEALKAICASDAFDCLKGICYTGLTSCRDLAVALALAMLGNRVCIGAPLPLWGSKKVRDGLEVLFKSCGGEFTHFDHPADAAEILQWFGEQ